MISSRNTCTIDACSHQHFPAKVKTTFLLRQRNLQQPLDVCRCFLFARRGHVTWHGFKLIHPAYPQKRYTSLAEVQRNHLKLHTAVISKKLILKQNI